MFPSESRLNAHGGFRLMILPLRRSPGRMVVAVLVSALWLCSPGNLLRADESPQAVTQPPGQPLAKDARWERYFEQHVRPILAQHCLKCHGATKQEGKLRLDSLSSMLKGGESGAALVPGKPAESLLLEAVRYESFEMPPNGQLSQTAIKHLEQWIAGGAVWPQSMQQLRPDAAVITDADRDWWAFRPLSKPAVPRLQQDEWSANEIDRFILQRLKAHELQPAPRADRRTLVRRLYFDLIGVPPTPEELQQFQEDKSSDAWERLVDRLLEDPRYGEHWARYWLDLVRYSESDGWNQDAYRPHIWRYRDYVIKSFNVDKPYPQFVKEQLAGDELPGDHPDHLIAAGFLRLGIYEYNQRDARGHWNDIMNEMTDVAGDVFLGMSMACARCHDHKFDPVPQTDYFKLRAFFEPVIWRDDLVAATNEQREEFDRQRAEWERQTAEIRGQIDALLKPYHDKKWKSTVEKFPFDIQACFYKPVEERNSWEHQMAYLVSRQFEEEGGGPLKSMSAEDKKQLEELNKQLAAFDDIKPRPLPAVMTVTDFQGQPASTLIPEDPDRGPVEPGFLVVLADQMEAIDLSSESLSRDAASTTGRRSALADWIGRPDNPLTTRVIVNRIWQQHFGEGIVRTPNDFGHNGQPPTHPELLDWLTVSFIEHGWSLKWLHKQILMSSAWRQSAHHPQADLYQDRDPSENWIWRASIRRLKAEQIRDAMLSVSGELKSAVGGPPVDEKTPRRAIYVKRFRNQTETFLHAFDAAPGLKSVAARNTTTTPTQSLLLINGLYGLERAKALAARLRKDSPDSPQSLIRRAVLLAWGREPTEQEMQDALQFLIDESQETLAIDANRLFDFCHILFNSSEFLYVD